MKFFNKLFSTPDATSTVKRIAITDFTPSLTKSIAIYSHGRQSAPASRDAGRNVQILHSVQRFEPVSTTGNYELFVDQCSTELNAIPARPTQPHPSVLSQRKGFYPRSTCARIRKKVILSTRRIMKTFLVKSNGPKLLPS